MIKKSLMSITLVFALIACSLCTPVFAARESLPADSVFDFSDSDWYSKNVSDKLFDDYYTSESYTVLKGNNETTTTFMNEGGETFTRLYANKYPWLITRFPTLAVGKYIRMVAKPGSGVDRVQVRWIWDNTTCFYVYFKDFKCDENGWYTLIFQVPSTGNNLDTKNKAFGFLLPSGSMDIKTVEIGDYFAPEKEKYPITAASIKGQAATIDFNAKLATVSIEPNLTVDKMPTLSESDILISTLTGKETCTPVKNSAKITNEPSLISSSIVYDVKDEKGAVTQWTFRVVSYHSYKFEFYDKSWLDTYKSDEAFDEFETYASDYPYFLPGNADTKFTYTTEAGQSFLRISSTRQYGWIILRYPGIAPGKYAKIHVRPSQSLAKVNLRWYFDPTRGVNANFDEMTPDENGWYTVNYKIEPTGNSSDTLNKLWGIVGNIGANGYYDIDWIEFSDTEFIDEKDISPITSAKIFGKDAFVDFENLTVSVDADNGLTTDTIGTLCKDNVEITPLNENVTVTPVDNSSYTQQTIAYVSANMKYDVTDANGNTTQWTIKNISRNGNVFDLSDAHWVKAHMSNEMYITGNPDLMTSSDPLLMPTNDGECNTELVIVKDGELSFLRAKPINANKYNWLVIRLDNIDQNKYIKYAYTSYEDKVNPRWPLGKGYGDGVTTYSNIHAGPSAWVVYKGNIGSCNTYNNHDLDNHAVAVHINKYQFDMRYFACFDTKEQMDSYDPSIQSATLNGAFAQIDPFAHKVIFDKDAGDLNDVELSMYFAAKAEKKGKVSTYPSGAVAQKYVVTDYEGGKTVWTVQLGEGDTDDAVTLLPDGSVKFNGAFDAKAKAASLYKDGKLIDIKTTSEDEIKFTFPNEVGIYKIKAYVWDDFTSIKPLAEEKVRTLSFGNILILGDSYSTFTGYIPSSNSTWYTPGGHENTDVTTVDQTWWKLIEASNPGNNIVLNESYSGTTICDTGYSNTYCPTTSFIGRFDALANSGFFTKNKIDTVFILGGTNDTWASSPVGTVQYSNWTSEDKKKAIPAFCYLLNRIKTVSPETEPICLINTAVSKQIADGYQEACDHYGVKAIWFNTLDKKGGHPSVLGMQQIKDQILDNLD